MPSLCTLSAKLVNGDFALSAFPAIPPNNCTSLKVPCSPETWVQLEASNVPGWQTTATDNLLEIWFPGYLVPPFAPAGNVVEMQANGPASLSQDLDTYGGEVLYFSFAHRGRLGVDTMSVSFAAPGQPADTTFGPYADGNGSWIYHSGSYVVPAGQSKTRVSFNVVTWATDPLRPGNGNELTHVQVTPSAIACPDSLVAFTGANSFDLLSNDYGQDLQITAVSAANGTTIVGIDGSVIYTPADGAASDTLTYTITDAQGNRSTSSTTFSVFAAPPPSPSPSPPPKPPSPRPPPKPSPPPPKSPSPRLSPKSPPPP